MKILRSGNKLPLRRCVSLGLQWAALANFAIALTLLATAQWWARPSKTPAFPSPTRPTRPTQPKWLVPLLLGAMLLGGALRWNFAHGSLWWDETWNLTRAVSGAAVPDPHEPNVAIFKPVTWQQTLYTYNKPTNHITFSVASRITLGAWRMLTGAPREAFSEFFFRMPNFLASLASIFLIGWLLFVWGLPRAGVVAAILLAIHPWHVRYGIDARAFSGMVLLSLASCLSLTTALRTGRWSAWILFGIWQMLLLWSFPYALFLTTTLGLAAIAGILFIQKTDIRIQLARLAVAGLLATALLLPLVAPLVPQMMAWTDVKGNNMIDPRFFREFSTALASGMPYELSLEPGAASLPSLSKLAASWPSVLPLLQFGLPLLCLLGLWKILHTETTARVILPGLILATPLAILVAYLGTHYFYARYVIYALVALLLLLPAGVEQLAALLRKLDGSRRRPLLEPLLQAMLIAALFALYWPQLKMLQTRSYSPNREVAYFLRDIAHDTKILAAGFNLGGDMPAAYNPFLLRFEKEEELKVLATRSHNEGLPLYIFYGYNSFNRSDEPKPFDYLDNPALFEVVRSFDGIESQFHYTILRYTGAELRPWKK